MKDKPAAAVELSLGAPRRGARARLPGVAGDTRPRGAGVRRTPLPARAHAALRLGFGATHRQAELSAAAVLVRALVLPCDSGTILPVTTPSWIVPALNDTGR